MILLYYDIIVLWYCFMIAWSFQDTKCLFLVKEGAGSYGGRGAIINTRCTSLFRWCSPLVIVYNDYYNFEHFPE